MYTFVTYLARSSNQIQTESHVISQGYLCNPNIERTGRPARSVRATVAQSLRVEEKRNHSRPLLPQDTGQATRTRIHRTGRRPISANGRLGRDNAQRPCCHLPQRNRSRRGLCHCLKQGIPIHGAIPQTGSDRTGDLRPDSGDTTPKQLTSNTFPELGTDRKGLFRLK